MAYALSASFAILVACLFVSLVSGAILFFVKWREINTAFKHPLLQVRSYKQYPFSMQAAITLDYFLRLMFTGRQGMGLVGNANRLLKHVDPKLLPFSARWPVAGFWGSCFLGIIAMVSVWILLIFSP